ncbi:MAG: hypothetical protein HW414_851 [Dehalococcoidia bacterium]|nr:hypothetical protein [Dehalococcoidia bacterium]
MPRVKAFVFLTSLFLLLALVVTSCAPKPQVAEKPAFVFKNNIYLALNGPEGKASEWYANEVFKRTGGRVKIETVGGGALGGIMENLKLTSQGVIDISGVMFGNHPAETPLSSLITFPFVIKDAYVMGNVMNEMYRTYKPFRDEYEVKNKVHLLAGMASNVGVGTATVPMRTAADFSGKKMRAFGNMNPIAAKLGATPVTIPSAEVYEALKRGTVVGDMVYPYAYLVLYKIYEVSNYVFDYGTGLYFNYGFIINLDTWNKLPKDIQKVMDDAGQEMLVPYVQYLIEADAAATAAMKAKGNQFYRFPLEEVAKVKALSMPLRDQQVAALEAKGIPAREFVAKYEALVKKYDPKSTYVHPFPK